jgi:hypothetical protein
VCIDVLYGDVLSRRCFVEETFCMCAIIVYIAVISQLPFSPSSSVTAVLACETVPLNDG